MRQKATGDSWRKRVGFLLIVLVLSLLCLSLLRGLAGFAESGKRLEQTQREVDSLRQEHDKLQALADKVVSGERDEEYIRDKLGLAKPDEVVVIIPEDLLKMEEQTESEFAKEKEEVDQPVWRQWLELFM